jgi:hypothetical protein
MAIGGERGCEAIVSSARPQREAGAAPPVEMAGRATNGGFLARKRLGQWMRGTLSKDDG